MNAISLPQYLIESSVCLTIFYVFYTLFLKKETFFQANRFYLIGTALFSLLVPFLHINIDPSSGVGSTLIYPFIPAIDNAQQAHMSAMQSVESPSRFVISIGDLIRIIYWVGVCVMAARFMDRLFSIFNLINRGVKKVEEKSTIVSGFSNIPASSFFSFIFWDNESDSDPDVRDAIMKHELVHVRQWHSLDVVFMEFLVILKWFNPLIYLYRNSLRLTHEYIADRFVTQEIDDKVGYANILLTHAHCLESKIPLQNTFYSQLKSRLEMLSQKSSSSFSSIKIMSVVPLAIGMIAMFSFDLSDRIDPVSKGMTTINSTFNEVQAKSVISIEAGAFEQEEDEGKALRLKWGQVDIGISYKGDLFEGKASMDSREIKSLLKYPVVSDSEGDAGGFALEVQYFNHGNLIDEYNYPDFREMIYDASNVWGEGDVFKLIMSPTFDWGTPNIHLDLELNKKPNKLPNIFRWGEILFSMGDRGTDSFFYTEYLNFRDFIKSIKQQPHFIGEFAHVDDFTFDLKFVDANGQLFKKSISANDDIYEKLKNIEFQDGTIYIDHLLVKDGKRSFGIDFEFEIGLKPSEEIKNRIFDTPQWYRSYMSSMPGNDVKVGDKEIKIFKSFGGEYMSKALRVTREELIDILEEHEIKQKNPNQWESVHVDKYDIQIQVSREVARNYLVNDHNRFNDFINAVKLPKGVLRSSRTSAFSLTESIYETMSYNPKSSKDRDVLEQWVRTLDEGDYFDLIINKHNGEISKRTTVSFIVSDGYEAFTPSFKLGKKYEGPIAASNYQMVYEQDGSVLVKVDARDPKNEKIVNAFADTSKYTLIDIPNYKTDYRILSYKEEITTTKKVSLTRDKGIGDLNIHYLKEHKNEEGIQAKLIWGRMISMPGIGNYSYKEFNRSRKTDLKIEVGDENLSISRFDIYIVDKEGKTLAYTAESVRTFELMQILKELKPETTIYLDNIIVDHDGEWMHLMDRYAFTFE